MIVTVEPVGDKWGVFQYDNRLQYFICCLLNYGPVVALGNIFKITFMRSRYVEKVDGNEQ